MTTEERSNTTWQGLMAGLIGYLSIMLLVGTADLLLGRSFFYTWSLLGQRLFYGLTDASQMASGPGPIFAFNGLHLVIFLGIGLAAAWLVVWSEKAPGFWAAAMLFVFLIFMHAFVAMLRVTHFLRPELPVALLGIPTVIALILMMGYLLHEHPRLRSDLRTGREE